MEGWNCNFICEMFQNGQIWVRFYSLLSRGSSYNPVLYCTFYENKNISTLLYSSNSQVILTPS